nr:hypothetical protein [Deltaproteobacteria bacterium]
YRAALAYDDRIADERAQMQLGLAMSLHRQQRSAEVTDILAKIANDPVANGWVRGEALATRALIVGLETARGHDLMDDAMRLAAVGRPAGPGLATVLADRARRRLGD